MPTASPPIGPHFRAIFSRKSISIADCIFFSLNTFTSGATAFLQPHVEIEPMDGYKRLAIVERLLGSALIALFLTAFLKVMIR